MKILFFTLFLFIIQLSFAQKTEFPINQEKARYQFNTQNIAIVSTTYKIEKGNIDADLKSLVIQLMEEKTGYLSVEFVNDEEIIVEHQQNVTNEMVLKTINRRGNEFRLKIPTMGIDR